MFELNCWTHEKLRDNLYVVHEKLGWACYNIFVVTGEEKTGIFDGGMAFKKGLRGYIEKNIVSGKPTVFYATHGDIDHIGAAEEFDEYYMSPDDKAALKYHGNPKRLLSETHMMCGGNAEAEEYIREHHRDNSRLAESIGAVYDGDEIDLGGISLRVFRIPGHTKGSLAYVNDKEHYVLIGDSALTTSSWGRCTDMAECLECHTRLMEALPRDVTVYNSHGYETADYALLEDFKQAFEDICNLKNADDEPMVLEFLKFVPRDTMEPEEFTHRIYVHSAGKARVPYNANVIPGWDESRK